MEKTAMKCNSNQFKHIKPKLKEAGIGIFMITEFKEGSYLCFFSDKYVTNGVIQFRNTYSKIYDEWDEETFLKICGIEPKEKTYKITREQILKYNMKYEFPEVFETKLTVGKWYKDKYDRLFCPTELINSKECKAYGFGAGGNEYLSLKTPFNWEINGSEREASTQEVTGALIKEAVKRGFKEGVYGNNSLVRDDKFKDYLLEKGYFEYLNDTLYWSLGDEKETRWPIFFKGQWAEIIPTITIPEAEAKLNCKII